MKSTDISNLRLISQQVAIQEFKTAKNLVSWMCAVQAQDFNMAKWAIGLRLSDATEKMVESAIDNGEVIRTHLLRPTWHIVASDDIYWLLELTASKIKASMKGRDRELGITEMTYGKSNAVIENMLSGGNHLSREEIVTELIRYGVPADNNRAAHLLVRAELEGIICSGKMKANKVTYALLPERVQKSRALNREEALAELAYRYFRSRCPASLQDFVWWSGLTAGESKRALEMIKSDFVSEKTGDQTYWFPGSFTYPPTYRSNCYLLPAFDEFIISYRDRSASLPLENHIKAVSNNGIFRPLIVENGKITGTWKRTLKKDKVLMETEFFNPVKKISGNEITKRSEAYGHFLKREIEMRSNNKQINWQGAGR